MAERSPGTEPHPAADHHSCSDEDLVAAAQRGTRSALEELLLRHYDLVLRVARRFSASAEDAEDVVQETMMRAFISIGEFRGEARFSSWLAAIAANAALAIKRKCNGHPWITLDEPAQPEGTIRADDLRDSHWNPEEEYLHNELCILVRRSVLEQPPKFRAMLRAYYFDGASIGEAALALRITVAAAKSRLFHARRGLLRVFRDQWEIRTR